MRAARVTLTAVTVFMALLIAGASFPALQAQSRRREPHPGPRAIAVLEWPPGTKPEQAAKTQPILVPAILYMNGRYFDASIYEATPTPMALQPGILYEAQKDGVFQGNFIISAARGTTDDTQTPANWYGVGNWDPAEKIAARQAERKKKEAEKKQTEEALKKELADDARPRLTHDSRTSSSNTPASATPGTTKTETTKKVAAVDSKLPPVGATPDDPNRPILRRGVAKSGPQIKSEKLDAPVFTGAALMARLVMPAVSDNKKTDAEDYSYVGSAADRERLRKQALELLNVELQPAPPPSSKAAKGKKPSSSVAAPPDKMGLQNLDFRVWDLFGVNQATVMLTATRGNSPAQYVALIAAEDAQGQLQKLLFETTSEDRLDVRGRLLPVGAVDAEGDGFAELLLRRVTRDGESFALYRSYGNQLIQLN